MAIETVILKVRRGPYGEFITDKQKLSVGEPCAVLSGDPSVPSGKAFYVCFQAGDARRMVSIEDLEIMVQRGDFKGDPGDPGTPGRGIKDIEVNTQSHLIFTMTYRFACFQSSKSYVCIFFTDILQISGETVSPSVRILCTKYEEST